MGLGLGQGDNLVGREVPIKGESKIKECVLEGHITYLWGPKSLFNFPFEEDPRKTQLHQQKKQIIPILTCIVSEPGRTTSSLSVVS